MAFDARRAWWYLTKQQKQDYLQWRLRRNAIEAKHIWPQTLPEYADVTGHRHGTFLQDGIAQARQGAQAIIVDELSKALRR